MISVKNGPRLNRKNPLSVILRRADSLECYMKTMVSGYYDLIMIFVKDGPRLSRKDPLSVIHRRAYSRVLPEKDGNCLL